jgi:hypothetical protein
MGVYLSAQLVSDERNIYRPERESIEFVGRVSKINRTPELIGAAKFNNLDTRKQVKNPATIHRAVITTKLDHQGKVASTAANLSATA